MVNKGRKPPLQLRLDDETEKKFRDIAAMEERDLSAQFKVIFREWLVFKGTGLAESKTDPAWLNEMVMPDPPKPTKAGGDKKESKSK